VLEVNALRAIHSGDLAIPITLQDLSAPFDAVDYATLLRRLDVPTYGLGCAVSSRFEGYLDGRAQFVRCGTKRHLHVSYTCPTRVECIIPQRSVLGPISFLLCTADLLRMKESRGLQPQIWLHRRHADIRFLQIECSSRVASTASAVAVC